MGGVVCLEMLPFGVWGGFNAFSFFFFFLGCVGEEIHICSCSLHTGLPDGE